jgi:hypothetical protein
MSQQGKAGPSCCVWFTDLISLFGLINRFDPGSIPSIHRTTHLSLSYSMMMSRWHIWLSLSLYDSWVLMYIISWSLLGYPPPFLQIDCWRRSRMELKYLDIRVS